MQLQARFLQWVKKGLVRRCAVRRTLSPLQAYAAGATATQWLDHCVAGTQGQFDSTAAGLFTSIIHQADRLHTSPASSNAGGTLGAGPSDVVLRQQQLNLPGSLETPAHTSVPVHQLVAVFSSMLDCPVMLHKDCRISSMEGKWRLLQLLLLHGAGDLDGFFDGLQQLLEMALRDGLHKIRKVRANPKIPAANKQIAEQQFHRAWTSCHDAICEWAEATCSGPTYATLQPALAELAPLLNTSVLTLAEELQPPTHSKDAGKLMEAAAVQAVREALPPGWSLLTSLHLLGVDGQLLTTVQRGCKFEADMLVLDQQGVAVAIIEVKLAAANPLMALVNDVAGLLRLVDKTAGRYLTCLTKSTSTAAAAAAAAGGGSSSSHSLHAAPRPNAELHQRLAAMTSRPPFSEGPSWHVLQVPVHAELLPVYVLGNGISDAAMNRGLNSLVSSSTLRLLSKSPAALVAAIRVQQAQPAGAQQQQHHAGHSEEQATASDQSNSSSSSSGAVVAGSSLMSLNSSRSSSMCWSGGADFDEFSSSTAWAGDAGTPRSLSRCSSLEATLHQKQQLVDATDDEEMEEKGAADEAELSTVSASAGVAAQLSGCGAGQAAGPQLVAALQTRSESLSSARARIRTQLHLTAEQQQKLARHINLRLTTLQERCKIYSLYKQD